MDSALSYAKPGGGERPAG